MASGIEMMLKSLGIDPKKIMADFETLMNTVQSEQKNINAKLDRIEKRQDELCSMVKAALRMSSQLQLVQPPQTQPPPQQEQPPEQNQPQQ